MFGFKKVPDLSRSGGYFILNEGHPDELRIKNTWVADGAKLVMRNLFRGEAVLAGTLYLGLTNAAYTFDAASLATLAGGESVGNGYARQALVRNTTDWTVDEVNGIIRAKSKDVSFTATGDWTQTWSRMFLCDQATGTAGLVYAVSGPAPAPRTVLSGLPPSVSYEFWMRG